MDTDMDNKKDSSKGNDDHDTSDDISETESIMSENSNEEARNVYQVNYWPAKPEIPKGYTFNQRKQGLRRTRKLRQFTN